MIQLNVCPSTLAEGYDTYSPVALKNLFDGEEVSPYMDVAGPASENEAGQRAIKNAGRISLSGVQPKFSVVVDGVDKVLRYSREGESGTYILKPRPTAYHILEKKFCPANEHLTMQIAAQVYGIETAANGLCFFQDDEPAYLTRRFDVYPGGKYQQEDFASILGYTKANGGSDYKYCNGSYEECAEVIQRHVKAARIDLLRFFKIVLFNFVTLNDDAHTKNFSLVCREGEYRLSPAYDLINTSLHLSTPRIFALDKGLFKEGMQLSDVRQVGRKDFEELGRRIGLPAKVVKKELDRFSENNPLIDELIAHSFLSEDLKMAYKMSTGYRRTMLTF